MEKSQFTWNECIALLLKYPILEDNVKKWAYITQNIYGTFSTCKHLYATLSSPRQSLCSLNKKNEVT